MNSLVSVIIPTLNRADLLKRALRSVIYQTFSPNEIIVVDNGSTDNTRDMIKENFQNIKYYFLPNKGVSKARNLGIKNSNSELIAFMDADDFWPDEKLEIQIMHMQKKNYSFSYTDFYFFFKDNLENKKKTILPLNYNYESFLKHSSMSTSSIIVKREIINNIIFENVDHEDYLFKCDILRGGEQAFKAEDTFVYYRINQNNRSSNKIKNILRLWTINKEKNNLNFFSNLKSLFFISLNSLKKYGWK